MVHRPEGDTTEGAVKKQRGTAQHADLPTTAVVDKNIKKVFDALNQADPQRLSEVLKHSSTQFNKIQNLLAFAGSSSGGSGSTPNAGLKTLLTDALTGALSILVKKYGYTRVITFFNVLLTVQNYSSLSVDYQEIVKNAMIKLYITVLIYGEKNIPISIIPPIFRGLKTPPNFTTTVPDLYVQQYFTASTDPYPGYIQWIGPNDEVIYTIRSAIDFPFETSTQHVYSIAEQGLATELTLYFENDNILLTIALFYALLVKYCNLMEDQGIKSTVGKNANSSSNLTQMLGSILGSLINTAKTSHIPVSVLDQSKMNQVISNQNKMQGRLNSLIKPALKKAVSGSLDSPLNLLSSIMGGGNVSSIIGNLSNLANLTGSPNLDPPSTTSTNTDQIQISLTVINNSSNIEDVLKSLTVYV